VSSTLSSQLASRHAGLEHPDEWIGVVKSRSDEDRIDASFATDDPENQRVREKSRIDPDVRACEGENQ